MAHGITEAQGHAVADVLVEAGHRPTVERIRAHLGTGSPNTVTRYLESWWGRLGSRLVQQRQAATLPAAPFANGDLAAQVWGAALRCARAEANAAPPAERAPAAQREAFQGEAHALVAQRQTHWRPLTRPSMPGSASSSLRGQGSGGTRRAPAAKPTRRKAAASAAGPETPQPVDDRI